MKTHKKKSFYSVGIAYSRYYQKIISIIFGDLTMSHEDIFTAQAFNSQRVLFMKDCSKA